MMGATKLPPFPLLPSQLVVENRGGQGGKSPTPVVNLAALGYRFFLVLLVFIIIAILTITNNNDIPEPRLTSV